MDKLILDLKADLEYTDDKPASVLLKHNSSKVLMLAIRAGKGLQPHTTHEDAILAVTEGEGIFTMSGCDYLLSTGSVIRIPAGVIHSLKATTDIKFLLIR